jgi:hypothetical protein
VAGLDRQIDVLVGEVAVISGIAFVVGVFFYYVAAPWNLIGKTDPVGGEAGYEQVAARAREQLRATGATWIATSDYRTYAMLRWHFNGQVPVIQINERGRFQGFGDPGMKAIKDHPGLYVAREPDHRTAAVGSHHRESGQAAGAGRARACAGLVYGYLRAGKIDGWTLGAVAPPDSPLFRWRVLAGGFEVRCGFVVRVGFAQNTSSSPRRRDPVRCGLSVDFTTVVLNTASSAPVRNCAQGGR